MAVDIVNALQSKCTDGMSLAVFTGVLFCAFIMAALRSRCGDYILPFGFFLSSIFFFIPRLISAAADWMSTILPHMLWP